MPAVSSIIGGIGAAAAVGGTVAGAFEDGSSQSTTRPIKPRTAEEKALAEKQLKFIEEIQAAQGITPDISNQFKDMLSRYLATGSSIGQPSPEAMSQATDYVDRTYTSFAQEQLRRQQSDLEVQAGNQATVLGRQVTDSDFQKNLAKSLQQGNLDIAQKRAGLIDEVAYQRPQQQLSFLSDLNQRAMQNRVALLNLAAQTGLSQQQLGLNERLGAAGQVVQNSPAGIGASISGIGGGLSDLGKAVGGFNFGGQGSGTFGANQSTAGTTTNYGPNLGNFKF